MHQDVELRRPVAEDHQLRRHPLLDQLPQQRPFRGDPHVPLGRDAQLLQPGLPGRLVGELLRPGASCSTTACGSFCRSQ